MARNFLARRKLRKQGLKRWSQWQSGLSSSCRAAFTVEYYRLPGIRPRYNCCSRKSRRWSVENGVRCVNRGLGVCWIRRVIPSNEKILITRVTRVPTCLHVILACNNLARFPSWTGGERIARRGRLSASTRRTNRRRRWLPSRLWERPEYAIRQNEADASDGNWRNASRLDDNASRRAMGTRFEFDFLWPFWVNADGNAIERSSTRGGARLLITGSLVCGRRVCFGLLSRGNGWRFNCRYFVPVNCALLQDPR